MNYEREEINEITKHYKNYVSNLSEQELLSMAYDHEIRMESELGENNFYIEPIFNQESRPNSMLVATMVDIGLSTNKLLTNAWFETHMRGTISVINQYIIVNCVRQILIDKSTQSVEGVLKLT